MSHQAEPHPSRPRPSASSPSVPHPGQRQLSAPQLSQVPRSRLLLAPMPASESAQQPSTAYPDGARRSRPTCSPTMTNPNHRLTAAPAESLPGRHPNWKCPNRRCPGWSRPNPTGPNPKYRVSHPAGRLNRWVCRCRPLVLPVCPRGCRNRVASRPAPSHSARPLDLTQARSWSRPKNRLKHRPRMSQPLTTNPTNHQNRSYRQRLPAAATRSPRPGPERSQTRRPVPDGWNRPMTAPWAPHASNSSRAPHRLVARIPRNSSVCDQ